jgi:ABC-type phosphate/phosphonate transport system substrate-binding protein
MKPKLRLAPGLRPLSFLLLLAIGSAGGALAQTQQAKKAAAKAPAQQAKLILAINEGGAANADSSETLFRYQEFAEILEKQMHAPLIMVAVRYPAKLKASLKKQEYAFLLSRPSDLPSEAIRDFGYRPVATAKEAAQTLLIVHKNSTLRTIQDVKGRTILTPDQYSHIWRITNAMLRDANIIMMNENVRAMRDQAAIGWSIENEFFDVAAVNSVSGVGRTWEKNGHRVIARSRPIPNMPLIASPQVTEAQLIAARSAVVTLADSDSGRAVLKKIAVPTGFTEVQPQVFLDFLKWIGDLEQNY